MSDEKKKSDEKKNHPKTSRPVRLKLATKPLPIYKCYRVWREINNLPMPSYPIRVESSDSLLAQLEALRSYQQQLTNYGNSLETTWGGTCSGWENQAKGNFEQNAAYAESIVVTDILYNVVKKKVEAQKIIQEIMDKLKKDGVKLPPELVDRMDEKKSTNNGVIAIQGLFGKVHEFVGFDSFYTMRLVQKSWREALYRSVNPDEKKLEIGQRERKISKRYPFHNQLKNIHTGLEKLSHIKYQCEYTSGRVNGYISLLFTYCCVDPLCAAIVVRDPITYGITEPLAYLLKLRHGWVEEYPVQEMIRLQLKYPKEFLNGYFVNHLLITCLPSSFLMKEFINPEIGKHVETTEMQKFKKEKRALPRGSDWGLHLLTVTKEEWGFLDNGIKMENRLSKKLVFSLKTVAYFLMSKPDFGSYVFGMYFTYAGYKNKDLFIYKNYTNQDWYGFYSALFFYFTRSQDPELEDHWRTYYRKEILENYPFLAIGIIAMGASVSFLPNVTDTTYRFNPKIVSFILNRYLVRLEDYYHSNSLDKRPINFVLSAVTDKQQREELSKRYEDVLEWLREEPTFFVSADKINKAVVKKIEERPILAGPILFSKIARKLEPTQLEEIAKLCVKGQPYVISWIIEVHGRRLNSSIQTQLLTLLPPKKLRKTIAYLRGINRLNIEKNTIYQLLSIVPGEKIKLNDNKRNIATSSDLPPSSGNLHSTSSSSSSSSGFFSSARGDLPSSPPLLDAKRKQPDLSTASTSDKNKDEQGAGQKTGTKPKGK